MLDLVMLDIYRPLPVFFLYVSCIFFMLFIAVKVALEVSASHPIYTYIDIGKAISVKD